MAGDANIKRSAYPGGDEDYVILTLGPFNVEASKTNHDVDQMKVPFAFKPIYAEVSSYEVAITNAVTIDVLDDTGTPQQIVQDHTLVAVTKGSAIASEMTIDDVGPVLADAKLKVRYTSGASDTSEHTKVRLWVKPLY
jgi:hypothetical protein